METLKLDHEGIVSIELDQIEEGLDIPRLQPWIEKNLGAAVLIDIPVVSIALREICGRQLKEIVVALHVPVFAGVVVEHLGTFRPLYNERLAAAQRKNPKTTLFGFFPLIPARTAG